jgi:hypothetical protein
MKHIKTYESFLNEGFMSELDIIRQESKSVEEFIKKAKQEFPEIAKMKDAKEFITSIWDISTKDN